MIDLKEHISRIIKEIEEDRIQIRLGRSAERHFGKVQNIIIQVDDQDITSQDDEPGLGKMNIVIKDDQIVVGDIFIPEKYRKQGIATVVYQKISDYFGLPIVNSTTKGFNQTMEGGYIWKKRDRFEPRSLQEHIRKVLKEETNFKISGDKHQLSESKIPIQVLRRHHLIDEMFKDMRIRYKRLFCNYRNPNILLSVLYERTLSDLYHAWFYETVSDDDWDFASEYIQKYLIDKYEKETIDLWGKRCKNKSSLSEEEELTEKCWKGYTQKGMKTMFGKRYPNCVKKKNKTLKEYWTPKEEDYSNIESAINKIIPKSFSWFKEIEIDKISYSEFSNTLTIYGELKVDEEWGAKQWREYYEYKPFPSNSGWEEEDPVRLGDIIGKGELDNLNDELELIVSSVGGYSIIDTMRLGQLKLYFV